MGTGDDTGTGTSAPFPLWMTHEQACAALGIKSRALRKRVAAGQVERSAFGRERRYRVLPAPAPGGTGAAPAPEQRHRGGTSYRHTGTGAALKAAPELAPSPELAELVHLVSQLTSDLVRSERDRGEAVGIGHAIADERDRLRAELDALRGELLELAGTSRAWTVRRRLLAAVRPRTVN